MKGVVVLSTNSVEVARALGTHAGARGGDHLGAIAESARPIDFGTGSKSSSNGAPLPPPLQRRKSSSAPHRKLGRKTKERRKKGAASLSPSCSDGAGKDDSDAGGKNGVVAGKTLKRGAATHHKKNKSQLHQLKRQLAFAKHLSHRLDSIEEKSDGPDKKRDSDDDENNNKKTNNNISRLFSITKAKEDEDDDDLDEPPSSSSEASPSKSLDSSPLKAKPLNQLQREIRDLLRQKRQSDIQKGLTAYATAHSTGPSSSSLKAGKRFYAKTVWSPEDSIASTIPRLPPIPAAAAAAAFCDGGYRGRRRSPETASSTTNRMPNQPLLHDDSEKLEEVYENPLFKCMRGFNLTEVSQLGVKWREILKVKFNNPGEEDFVNRVLQLERHHVKTRQTEYEERRRARQEAALEAAKSAEMQLEKMMPKWWTLGDLQDPKYLERRQRYKREKQTASTGDSEAVPSGTPPTENTATSEDSATPTRGTSTADSKVDDPQREKENGAGDGGKTPASPGRIGAGADSTTAATDKKKNEKTQPLGTEKSQNGPSAPLPTSSGLPTASSFSSLTSVASSCSVISQPSTVGSAGSTGHATSGYASNASNQSNGKNVPSAQIAPSKEQVKVDKAPHMEKAKVTKSNSVPNASRSKESAKCGQTGAMSGKGNGGTGKGNVGSGKPVAKQASKPGRRQKTTSTTTKTKRNVSEDESESSMGWEDDDDEEYDEDDERIKGKKREEKQKSAKVKMATLLLFRDATSSATNRNAAGSAASVGQRLRTPDSSSKLLSNFLSAPSSASALKAHLIVKACLYCRQQTCIAFKCLENGYNSFSRRHLWNSS